MYYNRFSRFFRGSDSTAYPAACVLCSHLEQVHALTDGVRIRPVYLRDSQLNVLAETAELDPFGLDSHAPVATFVEPYRGRPQLKGMRVRSRPAGAGSGRWRSMYDIFKVGLTRDQNRV